MNKQFAVIGLSSFGCRALEELILFGVDILIIDKDEEVIERYKDQVSSAFVADVTKIDTITKIIPKTLDAVIIDLGDSIEASILITHYFHELGVKEIIARAETDGHGNILKIVGATMVIFPNKEAVKRVIPMLISPLLMNYVPISMDLTIAEVKVPNQYINKTLIESNLRSKYQMVVIAIKNNNEYKMINPEYLFLEGDIALVAGTEKNISNFLQAPIVPKGNAFANFFKIFISGSKKESKS